MTRRAKTLAHILAATVEITALTALTCVWLTIATLADVEPEVDLDPEPDDPCRWAEFRANVAVNEAGRLLDGIEALRGTDDVLGLFEVER